MPTYTNKQIGTALIDTKGMVYLAAKTLGCSPNTIKARLDKTKSLRDLRESIQGETTDTVELKLYTAILQGEPWAVQFYLKTRGKDRGYTEQVRDSGTTEIGINVVAPITSGAIVEATKALVEAGLPIEGITVPYHVSDAQQEVKTNGRHEEEA